MQQSFKKWGFLFATVFLFPLNSSAQFDPNLPPESRQFDFWIGEWDVVNLTLVSDGTWKENGRATNKVYAVVDGKAIVEHWEGYIGTASGNGRPLKGFSIRSFNPASKKWDLVLNWPGVNRISWGYLSGVFRHGRGDFYSKFTDNNGVENTTRYSFSDIHDNFFRWDGSNSKDGGQTWNTNWIMEFTKRNPETDLPLFRNGVVPADETDYLCAGIPQKSETDFFLGQWEGVHNDSKIMVNTFKSLNGCAVITNVISDDYESYAIRSYMSNISKWVEHSIDSERDYLTRYEGEFKEDAIEFNALKWDRKNYDNFYNKVTWMKVDGNTIRWVRMASKDKGATWETVSSVDLKKKF